MTALSLLQPWASLVIMGVKKIETRSWSTRYRGTMLIHASLGKAGEIFVHEHYFKRYIPDFRSLPFGAIIGMVTLEDILPAEEFEMSDEQMNRLTLEEKAFGDYTRGRYGWILSAPVEFKEPIPARGLPGLWQFDGARIAATK